MRRGHTTPCSSRHMRGCVGRGHIPLCVGGVYLRPFCLQTTNRACPTCAGTSQGVPACACINPAFIHQARINQACIQHYPLRSKTHSVTHTPIWSQVPSFGHQFPSRSQIPSSGHKCFHSVTSPPFLLSPCSAEVGRMCGNASFRNQSAPVTHKRSAHKNQDSPRRGLRSA